MSNIKQIEIWSNILGYEGRFEASDLGRVRSLDRPVWHRKANGTGYWQWRKGKVLAPRMGGKTTLNYHTLELEGRTEYVQRLVLLAFRGAPPTPRHEASHLDGDRFNNRLDNLLWESPEENAARKREHGTALSFEVIDAIVDLAKTGRSGAEIARLLGIGRTAVYRYKNGGGLAARPAAEAAVLTRVK